MREVAGSAGADGYVLRGTVNTLPVVLLLRSPWYCRNDIHHTVETLATVLLLLSPWYCWDGLRGTVSSVPVVL